MATLSSSLFQNFIPGHLNFGARWSSVVRSKWPLVEGHIPLIFAPKPGRGGRHSRKLETLYSCVLILCLPFPWQSLCQTYTKRTQRHFHALYLKLATFLAIPLLFACSLFPDNCSHTGEWSLYFSYSPLSTYSSEFLQIKPPVFAKLTAESLYPSFVATITALLSRRYLSLSCHFHLSASSYYFLRNVIHDSMPNDLNESANEFRLQTRHF